MKAHLLIGSPRTSRSASETLGTGLSERLEGYGFSTVKKYVYRILRDEERLNSMLDVLADAELVIFSSPLYVDALPAPVTELLEILSRRLSEATRVDGQRLVAISNAGFPEAEQNEIALGIYRCFARQTGFV